MAIGAITMILANVGLQIYNNWCGSRQNEELQIKRQEFERAAKERNIEHMWKLLREGQELTRQLEEERHKYRLDELKSEIDNLLQKLTYESTISNWPLKVLPLVMKNQAFGNLLANQEENVAMHVIFTRSNYDLFNNLVYPLVEKELEQFCDKHWSTISDHPIMFYSGAWKSKNSPTEVQVSSMRTALNNLPTLLIIPFFQPNDGKLVFQIHLWGVGASGSDQFNIPEIEPTDFQRQFTNMDDYENTMGLLDEIVEDLVPYLQCLIGYMADTYFWSSAGLAPHLPLLVTNGSINTDGMKYLVSDSREFYEKLLLANYKNPKDIPSFFQDDFLNLYEGCVELLDEKKRKETFNDLILCFFSNYTGRNINSINELCDADYSILETAIIDRFIQLCPNENIEHKLKDFREKISHKPINIKIRHLPKLSLKEVINNACSCIPHGADTWHLFQDKGGDNTMIAAFFSKGNEVIYNQPSDIIVYFTQQIETPLNFSLDSGLDATIEQLEEMSKLM